MERRRRRFDLDPSRPRVLPRRLIEVAVHTDETRHQILDFGFGILDSPAPSGRGSGEPSSTAIDSPASLSASASPSTFDLRPSTSFFRNTAASGGSVRLRLYGLPCAGISSASTPPRFPTLLPPY